jgi:hypothetical protein
VLVLSEALTSLLKLAACAYNKESGGEKMRKCPRYETAWRSMALLLFAGLLTAWPRTLRAQEELENEVVANLAGGRVIVDVSKELISFAVINHPIETNSHPPRVLSVDGSHIGVLFGAEEWQLSADPKPVRLDHDFQSAGPQDSRYQGYPDNAEPDLESIGTGFLERLRPLVSQLHNKLNLGAEEPIFEVIVIGYAKNYGPEVWQLDYRIEQEDVGTRGKDYWQTHILRPRFTQLYPPEGKKSPRRLVETRYPEDLEGADLNALIVQDDPRIGQLRAADPRFAKVLANIDKGETQKAADADSTDLLRAMVPLIAGNARFALGKMSEQGGFDWVVPPDEPIEAATPDKNQPPEAPTLRRKPKPQ